MANDIHTNKSAFCLCLAAPLKSSFDWHSSFRGETDDTGCQSVSSLADLGAKTHLSIKCMCCNPSLECLYSRALIYRGIPGP